MPASLAAPPASLAPPFTSVSEWIFDLDNTLYPASTGLFSLIDQRMISYISELLGCDAIEARKVQKAHFHTHGTTLAGLMKSHDIDPHQFLADVHAIPLDRIAPDPRLVSGLGRLPGRKFIFTNGDAPYATRVLNALGLSDAFDGLHDIHACDLRPKPNPHGYRLLCDSFGIDPARSCLVEDMAQNLRPAKALGMVTVWVDNGSERGNHDYDPSQVDLVIDNVGTWLEDLLGDES